MYRGDDFSWRRVIVSSRHHVGFAQATWPPNVHTRHPVSGALLYRLCAYPIHGHPQQPGDETLYSVLLLFDLLPTCVARGISFIPEYRSWSFREHLSSVRRLRRRPSRPPTLPPISRLPSPVAASPVAAGQPSHHGLPRDDPGRDILHIFYDLCYLLWETASLEVSRTPSPMVHAGEAP